MLEGIYLHGYHGQLGLVARLIPDSRLGLLERPRLLARQKSHRRNRIRSIFKHTDIPSSSLASATGAFNSLRLICSHLPILGHPRPFIYIPELPIAALDAHYTIHHCIDQAHSTPPKQTPEPRTLSQKHQPTLQSLPECVPASPSSTT